jgi:hypothetical protein
MPAGVKYGGRKKGTPNKVTAQMKALVKDALTVHLYRLEEYLDELETKDRLDVIAKLLPYIMPKATETVEIINHNKPPTWFEATEDVPRPKELPPKD